MIVRPMYVNLNLFVNCSTGLPTYAPVTYSAPDDLPPPPPPTGGAYHMPADDPLPPPPPELTQGSPYGGSNDPLPPPPPLNPYNEPRPPVQAYKQQPSYQQKPVKMNGSQAAPKPSPKPAAARAPTQEYYVPKPSDQPIMRPEKKGTEAEIDALTSLLVQNMDSGVGEEEGEFFGKKDITEMWLNYWIKLFLIVRFVTNQQSMD